MAKTTDGEVEQTMITDRWRRRTDDDNRQVEKTIAKLMPSSLTSLFAIHSTLPLSAIFSGQNVHGKGKTS